MIIVKLMGGLGNQMFQYALGRNLSLKHNVPLKLDVSYLNNTSYTHIKREFELDIFGLPASIASNDELNKFYKVRKSRVIGIVHRFLPFLWPYYTINESTHAFDAKIIEAPANILLNGFWQTERYFKNIEDVIRKDFTFKPLSGEQNITLAETIKSSNAVGIHVRRGDYVASPETHQYHGTCSLAYYTEAIKIIKQKTDGIKLFVFSDDVKWVKENMTFNDPFTIVDNNYGVGNHIDMQLMSLCKHNIIANSSFSWWGAWLNSFSEKVVVAPAKWFNDTSINTSDVIPANWIKI